MERERENVTSIEHTIRILMLEKLQNLQSVLNFIFELTENSRKLNIIRCGLLLKLQSDQKRKIKMCSSQ